MPAVKSYSDDIVPTMDEIHRLLEHPDRRIKTIVLVMISSGIRVGSWDFLQWKHVVPIERDNKIIAAKLIIKNTQMELPWIFPAEVLVRNLYSFLATSMYITKYEVTLLCFIQDQISIYRI